MSKKPLVTSGQEWSWSLIEDVYCEIERIAKEKYRLDGYPNQLEIISSEQMLDAYCNGGFPICYPHWSFGELFVKQLESYKRGQMGLAYEIVLNSNPCIAYLMEENTMLMQTLVIAHACFGHNHVFKHNYLFKQWTNADAIIDYLVFTKKYILECEEKYGPSEVERVLDAAHAIGNHGIDKFAHPPELSAKKEEKRRKERENWIQSQLNLVWNTIPRLNDKNNEKNDEEKFPKEPEENILYFIEKNAPRLETWKREIIRIVRKISQYFYPQRQTQLLNEGLATFIHYKILHDLHDEGIVDTGAMLEFYQAHSGVTFQPVYDKPYYNGINPYALGFDMMRDIERISKEPTEEDRDWFGNQDWVGSGDYISAIHFAVENFQDESFILQYLSPTIIREFKLFQIFDDENDSQYEVTAIHNTRGFSKIRNGLSAQYNIDNRIPDIQVINVDRWGDRSMTLEHKMFNKIPMDTEDTTETLDHLSYLWGGYPVNLHSTDNGSTKASYTKSEHGNLLDVFIDD